MRNVTSIADFVGIGKENATSSSHLMAVFNCGSTRKLRQLIQTERLNTGAAILPSGYNGYYLADRETPEGRREIKAFTTRMRGEAAELVRMADAVEGVDER